MQISNNDSMNFKAQLSSKVKIKHFQKGKWQDKSVSFIKFDTNKRKDRAAIEEVSKLWQGKNYSASISEEAEILKKNSKVYGITLQNEDFSNINSEKVLGLLTTDEIDKSTKAVEIYRMGVIPEFSHSQKNRKVKHIGKALIEGLKKVAEKQTGNNEVKIKMDELELETQKAKGFAKKVLAEA